jgi:putative flippase GtrA
MLTFTKAQLTSVLATGVDFVVTILLVQVAGMPYLAGSATGTISGGATNFLISRNWVFTAQEKKWAAQLPRFILVWIGSMVLNIAGLYLLTRYAGINYLLSKIVIAVGVAVFYNYVLQKRFVFK